ncbi:MAG TPA: hypothetical protein PKL29_05345 [Methanothrix sp.]|nr:hypothetical protein [Methanothrix sp.]
MRVASGVSDKRRKGEKLKAKGYIGGCQETEKMKRITALAVLFVLCLAVPQAMGQMSEYQRGVANGLKIGLFMGEYYGRGQYVVDYAGQYNTYLDSYYQFLYASFANNQTLINEFMRSPIAVATKSSSTGVLKPDASGRILGYPAESYYTWVGAVPGTYPENPGNSLPGV